MRLSQNQIDYLAIQILRQLREKPGYKIKSPEALVAAVRTELVANMRAEQAIIQEAEARIAPHRQRILQEGADYQELVQKGVKAVAKEKGFIL